MIKSNNTMFGAGLSHARWLLASCLMPALQALPGHHLRKYQQYTSIISISINIGISTGSMTDMLVDEIL